MKEDTDAATDIRDARTALKEEMGGVLDAINSLSAKTTLAKEPEQPEPAASLVTAD